MEPLYYHLPGPTAVYAESPTLAYRYSVIKNKGSGNTRDVCFFAAYIFAIWPGKLSALFFFSHFFAIV